MVRPSIADPPLRRVLAATWGDDLSAAQKTDKVAGVVPLIGPQTFYFDSLASLTLDHVLGRFPLRAPRGLTHQKIDQQPVSVLHQGMRPVTKLSLFTRPFAHQKTVRIGARLMGVVAALLTVKIHPAVAPIARIVISRSFFTLGPKLLRLAQASIQRPVH